MTRRPFAFTEEELARAHAGTCPLCKAAPGAECRSTIRDHPLTRAMHFARLELRADDALGRLAEIGETPGVDVRVER